MMTKKLWLGMVVMALGMAFAAYASEYPAIAGIWRGRVDGSEVEYRFFDNGRFNLFVDGNAMGIGTYTARAGRLVMTTTHFGCCCGLIELEEGAEGVWRYSISGNTLTLTLTMMGETITMTLRRR